MTTTNVSKSLCTLLGIVAASGCAQLQEPSAAVEEIAALDKGKGVVFVDPAYSERLAKLWRVENPSSNQWLISRGKEQPLLVNVVRKAPKGMASATADKTYKGCTCSGDNPPGSDDTGCMRSPNTGGSQQVKQTFGYSYCKASGNPNDLCDASSVKVGDWIYYSDPNCQTETKREAFNKLVCLP